MTVDDLLSHLDAVRRQGRGWVARCPAHQPDRHPSLSISEGERGILVKCWAGCELQEITSTLGLRVSDLFFASEPNPQAWREARQRREADRRTRIRAEQQQGLEIDVMREAELLVLTARGIDISDWSNAQLDLALNRLADAYGVLDREGGLYE